MKNIVRASVIALVLTGAAASTMTSAHASTTAVTASKVSALPTPMCAPGDPNGCGIYSVR